MDKREIAESAILTLEKLYPDAKCTLDYREPYELLFAARLAAQCTDARVNIVTKTLFKQYTTLQSFADAYITELETVIRPCGFYKTKAMHIKAAAEMLIRSFGGEIPQTMDDLLRLPGIGRKTANLIMGDIWGKPAIVTDTHCIRITGRLGLTSSIEPTKVESELSKLIPPEKSSDFCHRIVEFGRDICRARSPLCRKCPMDCRSRPVNGTAVPRPMPSG